MILDFFNDLKKINGIEGIVIFSKDNLIIDHWSNPQFNTKIYNDLSQSYLQIFAINEKVEYSFEEVVLTFDNGQVYARNFPEFLMLVITKLNLEIELIRLILNVNYDNLINSRKMKKELKKFPQNERSFLNKNFLDDVEETYLNKINLWEKKKEK